MRCLLTLLTACCWLASVAQQSDAHSAGMGNMFIGLNGLFAAVHNQAGLAKIRAVTTGVSVRNSFLLKNLNTTALAVAVPLGKGTAALDYGGYGYKLYRENRIALSYAMPFGPKFSMGIRINYRALTLGDGLGSSFAFFPDAGMEFLPAENLKIGLQFENITFSKKIRSPAELWVPAARLGIMYGFNDKFRAGIQGNVYAGKPPQLNTGLEYRFTGVADLRLGFALRPVYASMGFGIVFGGFIADISGNYGPDTGFSPTVNLIYAFKN